MLIGIHGKMGSGKDTLASELVKLIPGAEIKKFAEKLKQVTSLLTGVPLEQCYSDEGKRTVLPEWGMTVGEFQQRLGTDAIRNGLHQNAWVITTLGKYNASQKIIISDVRFQSEAWSILERGGILIRITRKNRNTGGRDENHPSETELDGWTRWDFQYENDGSLEDLKQFANMTVFKLWEDGFIQ